MLTFPYLLLASLITFKRFDIIRVYLKDKRKVSHGIIMFPKENHILFYSVLTRMLGIYTHIHPVYKKAFYFQRHYIPSIKEYHEISIMHPDGQRFTHFESSFLHEHLQQKQTMHFLVWADNVELEYPDNI